LRLAPDSGLALFRAPRNDTEYFSSVCYTCQSEIY
jgi:hypothetical protein